MSIFFICNSMCLCLCLCSCLCVCVYESFVHVFSKIILGWTLKWWKWMQWLELVLIYPWHHLEIICPKEARHEWIKCTLKLHLIWQWKCCIRFSSPRLIYCKMVLNFDNCKLVQILFKIIICMCDKNLQSLTRNWKSNLNLHNKWAKPTHWWAKLTASKSDSESTCISNSAGKHYAPNCRALTSPKQYMCQ